MGGVIDWTASAQTLSAPTSISSLLRTAPRTSVWISWPVLRVSVISSPSGSCSLSGSHLLLTVVSSLLDLSSKRPGSPAAAVPAGGMIFLRCLHDPAAGAEDGRVTMVELDAAGLSWTSWDMIQKMRRADQAHSGTTDATRTERGFHAARVGEIAGQRPFRWVTMG